MHPLLPAEPRRAARLAGALYVLIIVLGLASELLVRQRLVVPGDAGATAANLLASERLFRGAFLGDSVMLLCDAAVGVLLYLLLRPVHRTLALAALAFRLTHTAVLALNLLNQHAAVLVLTGAGYTALGPAQRDALAYLMLDRHAHGYDLGLLFFGVHCLLVGILILRSSFLPRLLGALSVGAAVAYLAGGYTRFLAPEALPAVQPLYGLALVGEVALAGWLLLRGVDEARWRAACSAALARWGDPWGTGIGVPSR